MVTAAQIKIIAGNRSAKHAEALANVVDKYEPHVQAQILAQVMHETGGLVYDREVWGPTKAQQGYEGRKDLGNSQKGDGSKYRGYGLIQVTGRGNTTAFYNWCKKSGMNPPDFVADPSQMAADPWAAWTVVWYWEAKGLTKYADVGDIEMITRRVNGGLNGYEDRLRYYDRAALVLLGYKITELQKFQASKGLDTKTGSGPRTRAALHTALLGKTQGAISRQETASAPVVETVTQTEAVAVTAPSMDAPWWKSKETIVPLIAGGGGSTLLGSVGAAGNMPTANLIVLVLSLFGILAAAGVVLYVLKKKDAKIVQAKVEAVQASASNAG